MTSAVQLHSPATVKQARPGFDFRSHPSPEELVAYHYQELTAGEQDAVQDHLVLCSQCVEFLQSLFETGDQPPPLSASRLESFWQTLLQESSNIPRKRPAAREEERLVGRPDRLDRLVEEVVGYVRTGLQERFSLCLREGHDPEEIGTAEQVAKRILNAVPAPSGWDGLLGPFYSTRQVADLLGISYRAVLARNRRGGLWGLKTSDGALAFPTLQFDENNQPPPGLREVLHCFRDAAVDDWTLAGWLVAPQQGLGGYSALQWVQFGFEQEPLLALACDTARRFDQ